MGHLQIDRASTMTIQRTVAALAAMFALAACVHGAEPEEQPGSHRVGKNVASNLCAGCHDVSDDYRAPPPRVPGQPPAFITVASSPHLDMTNLIRFVRFPHGEMDNVVLTRKETDAVVGYILSLKRP